MSAFLNRTIAAALAGCLAMSASGAVAQMYNYVIGYDKGPVTVTGTPANSSHAAGSAVGPAGSGTNQAGLFTVPIARTAGHSGIITSFLLKDTNGVAESYVLRAWSKFPANTTCQDGAAFVGSNTDDQYLIGGGPVTVTTAAPGSAVGDSAVYVALTNLVWDYLNADSTPTKNVYVCLVTTATYTPSASKPMYVTLSGPQN